MAKIHPTAIVEDGAVLGAETRVGPYCVVGPQVVLGDGVELVSHVSLAGLTEIGEGSKIYPFASIGHPPQDLKYHGEESRVVVGRQTTIREQVTISPGTEGGGLLTRVGDHCLLMVGAHVAHDCKVGDHVILVNNATLAGHVSVGDHAILGGLSAVHQWVRIGAHSFLGGLSGLENDLIPYGSAIGDRARLGGLNIVGLKRRGFERENIHRLRAAYRMLFSEEGTLLERVEDVATMFADEPLVMQVVEFIREGGDRRVCMPRSGREG
ncbi:acyl-ACP--UDP-N-acetylglucosamine O-acyltransferase [Siculibacillus lacustris]|uniref:Acyl-[acyl-carrier-protein]--UDP-N-acetylglucosamine O-acyltransferase n=1 Tax=Siculibacillus lacustris TaxID=1549641 RepID=A0A4Q9VRI7_9HYPH|nr:acyl-ACP--UDP-N-acetylglucosamine O-acyltransferase [Siculibacillus lacustris]TBW38489.1 acyl-ACP--UDP-N-acetylglucosamine O-acyltransferase [Siculibacillus lacustris]